jgi:hypothetical protein
MPLENLGAIIVSTSTPHSICPSMACLHSGSIVGIPATDHVESQEGKSPNEATHGVMPKPRIISRGGICGGAQIDSTRRQ